MCCFAQPVQSVGQTKIFARLTGKGTQFIAYQMEYESQIKNAMILPIPAAANATEDSVRFIDMKQHEKFFKELNYAFPQIGPPPGSKLTRSESKGIETNSILKVQEVGDFIASVVPKAQDFNRLDPQFSIAPETWAKIPEYSDYSFVVFQLEKLAGQPHPMTFEFNTREEAQLFFPTIHIHDGEVHTREDFDHTLYCQHAAFDSIVDEYTTHRDKNTMMTRSKGPAGDFIKVEKSQGLLAPDLLIHRKSMRGRLPNRDVLVRASGDPVKLTMGRNKKRWIAASTLLGASLLPLGWVIRRRQKRAAEKMPTSVEE